MSRLPRPLLALVLAGAVLRAGLALRLQERTYQSDETVYVELARGLRQAGVYGMGGVPAADRPPLTSFAIAGAFSVFGERLWAARLCQAALSVLTVLLLYEYGTMLFGAAAGAVAAGIAAVYPFFVYWSGILMSETLTIFLAVAALLLTQRAARAGAPAREAWLAGACWGLAALTRSQNLWCWAAILAWLAFDRLRTRGRFPFLAFSLPVALLLSLWAWRNHRVLGAWTLDTHSGYTMIIRTMFYDEDNVDTGVAEAALRKTDFYAEAQALPPPARDKLLLRKALEWARAHPVPYLRHCAGNFVQFWRFYPRVDKTVGVTPESFLFRGRGAFVAVSLLTEPWLILLGAAGLLLAAREGKKVAIPALYVLVNTAIHTLVIAQMRYRMPVMPVVIMLASYALVRILESRRTA